MNTRKNEMIGNAMLFVTAFIWGTAFVAQSVALDLIGPFTINGVRSLVAAVVLCPVAILFRKKEEARLEHRPSSPFGRWTLLVGGVCCGLALCVATNLQQIGLLYTSVGKAGFITSLYLVLVPILGLFLGKKVQPVLWICVAIALVGLYLLSLQDLSAINTGDLLVLLCALVFAIHIQTVDYFAPRVNGVALSCLQFLTCGIVSSVPMLLWEAPSFSQILAAAGPILYAGVLSSGVAYTLQILGQERTNPVTGSLLMSMESVWALVGGFVILKQTMKPEELLGCGLMLFAMILSQLPIMDWLQRKPWRRFRGKN